MRQPSQIRFFPNGNAVVLDQAGQQIPELNTAWILLFCNYLKGQGVRDIPGVEFILPNGQRAEVSVDERGFNWRIADGGAIQERR